MNKFLRELRRREVFRTAGLYIGISWILIEVASVLLPAFGAPDWLVRGAIVVAICGFPVMLVLAWFFDADEEGVHLQVDPSNTTVQPSLGIRRSDFVIMGVLLLALLVSIALNVRKQAPTSAEARLEPIAVLVAGFDKSNDNAGVARAVELALAISLEAAPQVDAFLPDITLPVSKPADLGEGSLDRDKARELARLAGIGLVLRGIVESSGDGFRITIEGIDTASGETLFQHTDKAQSADGLNQAVVGLSERAMKALGLAVPKDQTGNRSFSASSIEAADLYAQGATLAASGELEKAAAKYAEATTLDPGLAYAWADLALVEYALERTDAADSHWSNAQQFWDTMTEREQLWAKAQFANLADVDAAVSAFAELVRKYPADTEARREYAELSFDQLDFSVAVDQMREVVRQLPSSDHDRLALSRYALYDGDWETARSQAERVLKTDSTIEAAYWPIAVTSLGRGRIAEALDTYNRMATASSSGSLSSVAALGLADAEIYAGRFAAAEERLTRSIDTDVANGGNEGAARKLVTLAGLYESQANAEAAIMAANQALELSDSVPVVVSAAIVLLRAGDIESTRAIASGLGGHASSRSQAYGKMLQGLVLQAEGKHVDAVFALREALDIADLWLIRLHAGEAYLKAGNHTEALDELTALTLRRGEATSVFLDDSPTYRVMSELPYWIGRAHEAQGTSLAARTSYEEFLALRPEGGKLANDAAERLAGLE